MIAQGAQVLTPNRRVSSRALVLLAATQVALALWLWGSASAGVLPRPGEVARAVGALWADAGLGSALLTSIGTSLEALAITAAAGLLISYSTVLPFFRPVVAAVTTGRFLGLVGLTFGFTLLFSGGHALRVSLLVFGMTVFFVTSMVAEIRALPARAFDHARTVRMGEWRVVLEVVVLGTADRALELLRQNAAVGWTLLTMVEGLTRAEGGAGAMLLDRNKHLRLDEVMAIQLCVLAVGFLQDRALGALRRLVCPHADLRVEGGRTS